MSDIKLCKDCVFYRRGGRTEHSLCDNPDYIARTDYVEGENTRHICAELRANTFSKETCGPEGRGWKQKEKTKWFRLLFWK